MLIAAGVTFYALLALVPALTALVSIYGIFADPATLDRHMDCTGLG
jgi:membrane protein